MDKLLETLKKLGGTIKDKWTALDKKIRILIIAITSVVIVSLIVLLILNSITKYAVLYENPSAEEATEIISVLQNDLGETDVKYNSEGIWVPANRVEELRAKLSIQGYPKSAFNYEVWDKGTGMFSTESDKRVKEIQQLQENLRATLAMFDGVDSAIVILNIPRTNNYMIAAGREEAGASVTLKLSHPLTADSISGIYNLVRTSVPGLKEENITVTDTTGTKLTSETLLALDTDSDEMELYYKRISLEQSITNIMKEKLVQLFKGAFTDYTVAVSVLLNYNDEVSQSTIYTPSVESEGNRGGMVDNEKYVSAGGGNAAEGGLVGTTVDSDISPDYPTLQIGDGDEFYYETQKEIHYLVNEEIKQVEKDGYSYDNISAAVVVDAADLTQAEIEEWQSVIANAIGTTMDKVTFKASTFGLDRTTGSATGDGSLIVTGSRNNLIFIIITLGVLLIVLLIIALVASSSSKKRARVRRTAAAAAATATTVQRGDFSADTDEEPSHGYAAGYAAEDFEIQSLTDNGEESRDAVLKKEIREFSNTNPEIVAQLIRTWMRGDE